MWNVDQYTLPFFISSDVMIKIYGERVNENNIWLVFQFKVMLDPRVSALQAVKEQIMECNV